jgi:hypothetical protein
LVTAPRVEKNRLVTASGWFFFDRRAQFPTFIVRVPYVVFQLGCQGRRAGRRPLFGAHREAPGKYEAQSFEVQAGMVQQAKEKVNHRRFGMIGDRKLIEPLVNHRGVSVPTCIGKTVW